MADETFASVENLLRDAMGPMSEALKHGTMAQDEIERDSNPMNFDGDKVKIPIMLSPLQGGGMVSESGTLNASKQMDHDKVLIDTGNAHITVSWTTKAAAAAKGGPNSWIDLIPKKLELAEKGMRKVVNEMTTGAGDALVAACTQTSTTSTTVYVGTSANWHQLYAGRIVDVLVRSSGATISLGREIADTDETLGTITLDSAISTASTSGLYIEGSYGQAGQGLFQAAALTADFQTLSKTSTPGWRGNRVNANSAPLSLSLLNKLDRQLSSRAGEKWERSLAHPATVDRFADGFTVQSEWNGGAGKLETGWTGVSYRGRLIVPDDDVKIGGFISWRKADVKFYTREGGPAWDEVGGMFKRFARALPYEAWLIWQYQLGFENCNGIGEIYGCASAA